MRITNKKTERKQEYLNYFFKIYQKINYQRVCWGPYSIVTDISCTVWVKIYPKKKNYKKTYKKYKKKFYYSHFIF